MMSPPRPPHDQIAAGVAVQRVVAAPAQDDVVAEAAGNNIVHLVPDEKIVSVPTGEVLDPAHSVDSGGGSEVQIHSDRG